MGVLSRCRSSAGLAVALVLSVALPAAPQRPGEDAVKAAFLYNFTKYVEWPEAAFTGTSAAFTVCVVAPPAFRTELRAILGNEQVRGRPIEIVTPGDGPDDLKPCHLVYVGAQEAERVARRLAALKQAPVLTVGEGRPFLQHGGMIAFLLEDNRVRFDISKRGADAAGLVVSSKLLRVARRVDGEAP
jgi:hypothetical protein